MVAASYSALAAATLPACGGRRGPRAPSLDEATRDRVEQAESFERRRRYDLARQRYRLAVKRAPDGASAAFAAHRFASALAFWGELEPAREMLELAVARDPSRASAWHDLGIIREKLGDRGGAEAALRRAMELLPRDPRPKVALAALLVKSRRCDGARALYRQLLRTDPPQKVEKAIGRALAFLDNLAAQGLCVAAPH